MTFPAVILDTRVHLFHGGVWNAVTSDVRGMTAPGGRVQIVRGRPDEAGLSIPTRAALAVNNRDGKYSPRNPTSPLFGLIGRNTPLRVSVGEPHVGAADSSTTDSTSHVAPSVTAAKAGLLVCAWAGAAASENYTFPGGMTAGPQTHGSTGSRTVASASQAVSAGASGTRTATVTTARSWAAASVLLHGASVTVQQTLSGVAAGSQTAPDVTLTTAAGTQAGWWLVAIQEWDYAAEAGTRFMPAAPQDGEGGWVLLADNGILEASSFGRLHLQMWARRVRRAGAQAVTFFGIPTLNLDNHAHLYVLSGVDFWSPRATVEVSAWPPRWDVSGKDVWVPVVGAGVLRRLGHGRAVYSAIRRATTGALIDGIDFGTSQRRTGLPVAYWPLEDASQAVTAASGLPGGTAMTVSGGVVEFGRTTGPGGSDKLPDLLTSTGRLTGGVPASVPDSSDSWTATFVVAFAGTNAWPLVEINGGQAFAFVRLELSSVITLFGIDDAGTSTTIGTLSGSEHNLSDGRWYHVQLDAFKVGSNAVYNMTVHNEDGSVRFEGFQIGSVTDGGNPGPVASVVVRPRTAGTSASMGHLAVFAREYDEQALLIVPAVGGHSGETAGRRMERLCGEQMIPFHPVGVLDDTTPMGPQRVDTLLSLLRECETADLGVLYEPREVVGLAYRTRRSLYNQAATLALTYGAAGEVAPPLEPTDDDQLTRNDVTVTRVDATGTGGSARSVQSTGPLSVLDPPDGVGAGYDSTVPVNVPSDLALPDQAGWRLHLGTVDEPRFPSIHVNLAALGAAGKSALLQTAAALDVGDRLTIASPPLWLPPETISQLGQGFSESLAQYEWEVAVNASPASPWIVGVFGDDRFNTDGSVLNSAVTSTATSLLVATTVLDTPLWTTDAAQTPWDIRAGGERMTVTAVASAALDTFTRSVSNGWGTATSGQAWTTIGGSASDYSVDGARGVILLPTGDTASRSLVLPDSYSTVDVKVTMRASAVATGANLNGYIRIRHVDSSNYYRLWVAFDTGGNVDLAIQVVVANTGTTLVSAADVVTYSAGSDVHARVQAFGSTLRGKVWTGSVEPAWTLTTTDTTYTSGQAGCRAVQSINNTNTNPTISYDNFEITNPQKLTVTRSVNTVVKSQAAGTDVTLWQPTRWAL